jgi:glucose-6-phosphate 1-dehydrogenase
MFQNHLLQLLALIAMEPPMNLDADSVRDRKLDVFKSVRPLTVVDLEENTICAQYGPGVINGQAVPSYREETGVSPVSRTATFAALRLELDSWRWQGVPFYIRAGKRLPVRLVEIAVQFKRIPTSIFKPLLSDQLSPNLLKFRIQPDEGITMRFEAKHPGPKLCMSSVSMEFGYQETFGTPPPESYARLFQDAMLGDQTLFARSDGVEECWRIIDPIANTWEQSKADVLITYPAGSWGPKEADALLAKSGRTWE